MVQFCVFFVGFVVILCIVVVLLSLPPTFIQQLQSQEAEEGASVSLRCELSKAGVPVQWKKGGVVLQPGSKYQMKQEASVIQLLISRVEPEDSGDYSCVCGQQEDHSQNVWILCTAAPVFLTELHSQDVPDGYPVSFDCVVIGKPPPTVRWYKDGKLLEENDHYMINEDQEGCHQLIITAVLPTDMGVYRCTAENSTGSAYSSARLSVLSTSDTDTEVADVFSHSNCCFLPQVQGRR
uniref:Ig-like domain-containing protein n=1 Tax=Gouania willdenowi TaxID=441366 RepID=A0A8C5DAJ5_GOUWI